MENMKYDHNWFGDTAETETEINRSPTRCEIKIRVPDSNSVEPNYAQQIDIVVYQYRYS